DGLGGLQGPDDPAEDPEHPRLRARRREVSGRRLRIEAAIARPLEGLERRDLPLEAEDGAVHDGDLVEEGRVVHEVTGREVVAAVHDDVPALTEDAVDV